MFPDAKKSRKWFFDLMTKNIFSYRKVFFSWHKYNFMAQRKKENLVARKTFLRQGKNGFVTISRKHFLGIKNHFCRSTAVEK